MKNITSTIWKMRTIPKSAWAYRKRGYVYALRFEIIGRLTDVAFLIGYIRGSKIY